MDGKELIENKCRFAVKAFISFPSTEAVLMFSKIGSATRRRVLEKFLP